RAASTAPRSRSSLVPSPITSDGASRTSAPAPTDRLLPPSLRMPTSMGESAPSNRDDALVTGATASRSRLARVFKALAPGVSAVLLLLAIWELVVWSGWKPEWVL